MRGAIRGPIVLMLALAGAGVHAQIKPQVKGAQVPVVAPSLTLEVQRSEAGTKGDIAVPDEWVTSMSIAARGVLRFRFGITEVPLLVLGAPKGTAEWRVYEGPPPPNDFEGKGANLRARGDAGEIPDILVPRAFIIDLGGVLPPKPDGKSYFVNVVGRTAAGAFTKRASPYVVVKYEVSTFGTKMQLDSLKVLSVVPQGGTLKGKSRQTEPLTAANSVEITFAYELNSAPQAEIKQWLRRADGSNVPYIDLDDWITVKKGKGTVKARVGVNCVLKGQDPTAVRGISFALIEGVTFLVKGEMPVRGVTFTCPPEAMAPGQASASRRSPTAQAVLVKNGIALTEAQFKSLGDDEVFELRGNKTTRRQLRARAGQRRNLLRQTKTPRPKLSERTRILNALRAKGIAAARVEIDRAKEIAVRPQSGPPAITGTLGRVEPGYPVLILGSNFGISGTVRLRLSNPKSLAEYNLQVQEWHPGAIVVTVPETIEGIPDQGAWIQVRSYGNGGESQERPVQFVARRVVGLLYSKNAASVNCSDESDYDACNGVEHQDWNVGDSYKAYGFGDGSPSASFEAFHLTEFGSSSGTDTFSLKTPLVNGCVIDHIHYNPLHGDIDPPVVHNEGSALPTFAIAWVNSPDYAFYSVEVYLSGPAGLACQ